MAKKQQVTETTHLKQISVALGFLHSGVSNIPDELRKNPGLKIVEGTDPATMLQNLRAAEAELKIVVPGVDDLRPQMFQHALKHILSEKVPSGQYFTIVSGSNKSRFTELLSGFGKAEWNLSAIAFGAHAFEKFISENTIPDNAFELAYIAEKTCCANEIISTESKEIEKPKPISALTRKFQTALKYYTSGGLRSFHKYLFLAFSAIALLAAMWMSKDAGISGDEFTQYEYSKLTANYYESMLGSEISVDTTGLKSQKMLTLVKKSYSEKANLATLEDPDRLMHLYGASFDTFTTLMIRWFGITEVMDFRHLINSIFGFLCVFFGALIVRRVTGGSWKYAWITLVILFFTPRLLGESFNNPKDIPFAAGYVMAIYYTLKGFTNLKVIRLSALIGLVFSIALGISIRIGGVLSIAIFIMYAGLQFIRKIGVTNFLSLRWTGFTKLLIPVLGVTIGGYLLGIFVWPYGWDSPIDNPMKAFKGFSNYSGSIRQLFEGKLFDSDMLPPYYLAKYILITTPIAAILGWAALLIFPAWKRTKFNLQFFLILFAAIFPVFFIFIQKSQVYGGLRHVLFTIPFFIICGIIGYYLLENWFREKKFSAYIFPGIALGLTSLPAAFIVQNHPLEYIYFNELVGGTKGAYGSYEMDYYLAGLRPSTEWFLENVARKNPEKQFKLLTYGPDQVKYYCRKDTNVKVGFTRYDDRSEKMWDYAIFYNAYLDKERLLGGKYPPVGTVYTPEVQGKPMGLVIKRPSYADYEGFQADRNQDFRLAVTKYQDYLKTDKNSNEVYLYLAYAYANLKNIDSAIWAAKTSVELYPEFSKSLFALNQFYNEKNDFDNAIKVMDQYLEARPKDADGFLLKAQSYARKAYSVGEKGMNSNLQLAIESVHHAIEINPFDARNYQLGTQIYAGMKDNLNAGQYNQAAGMFSAKDAKQYNDGLEAMKGIYLSITGKELDTSKLEQQ